MLASLFLIRKAISLQLRHSPHCTNDSMDWTGIFHAAPRAFPCSPEAFPLQPRSFSAAALKLFRCSPEVFLCSPEILEHRQSIQTSQFTLSLLIKKKFHFFERILLPVLGFMDHETDVLPLSYWSLVENVASICAKWMSYYFFLSQAQTKAFFSGWLLWNFSELVFRFIFSM